MTKQEYSDYQEYVASFFRDEHITNLSTINDIEGDTLDPSFSWQPCDCCGSSLGGDRYKCNGWNDQLRAIQDYDHVCPDCVYYAEYGRLDDMTMMDIED